MDDHNCAASRKPRQEEPPIRDLAVYFSSESALGITRSFGFAVGATQRRQTRPG